MIYIKTYQGLICETERVFKCIDYYAYKVYTIRTPWYIIKNTTTVINKKLMQQCVKV